VIRLARGGTDKSLTPYLYELITLSAQPL